MATKGFVRRTLDVAATIAVGGTVLWAGVFTAEQAASAPVALPTDGPAIVWTTAPCGYSWIKTDGCFDPATPDVIYVDPTAYDVPVVIAHEIGHWHQYNANPAAPVFDECEADAYALAVTGRVGPYAARGLCG